MSQKRSRSRRVKENVPPPAAWGGWPPPENSRAMRWPTGGDGTDGDAAVRRDDHLDLGLELVADGVGGLARVAVEGGSERDPVAIALDDRGVPDALLDVPLHLPDDLVVLGLDLRVDDRAPPDEVVADVLTPALPHHHLAEHLRPGGILVFPEVVVADDPRNLFGHRIAGGARSRATIPVAQVETST